MVLNWNFYQLSFLITKHEALEAKISNYSVSIHFLMINCIANMLKTAVSPCHGFEKNMAYVMMNHLLKSEPTNLEVNYGCLVHSVSVGLTYKTREINPLNTDPQSVSFTMDFSFFPLFFYKIFILHIRPNTWHESKLRDWLERAKYLSKGRVQQTKNGQIILILWISVLPSPPLSTSA